ncbi:MAG: hypothetical protein JWN04_6135 [Myxococcaceae bacterium]|nr:hypothetical protein [Myxococcaceae bacterium]
MKLCLSHQFDAPLESVLGTLSSADYASHLAQSHSFFADVRVLSLSHSPGLIERSVRYRARPFITRLGVFSLPASWFVWVEQSRIDLRSGLLTFENVPEVESVRDKLINRGSMQFRTACDADGKPVTVRQASFEVAFQVPQLYRSLAALALTMVRRQLESSLDEEARLLRAWLCRRPAGALEPEASAA